MSPTGLLWAVTALLALNGVSGFTRKCEQLTSLRTDLPEPKTSRGHDVFAIVCEDTNVMCVAYYEEIRNYNTLQVRNCDEDVRACLEDETAAEPGEEMTECPNVDACIRDEAAKPKYRVPHQGARVPDLRRNGTDLVEKQLDLSYCDIAALPSGWRHGGRALRHLDLSGNRFSTLNAGSFSGRLNEINLADNLVNLTIESEAFVNLPALKRVNLRGSKIVSLAPHFIVNSTRLVFLDLQQNSLVELPEGAFEGLRALQTLELSENYLRALPADIFRGLHNLRDLSLRNNEIVELPSGLLQPLTSLRSLSLSGNRIEVLNDFVVTGLPRLRNLALNNNAIRTIYPNALHGVDLDQLDLSQNRITLTESWAIERSPFYPLKNLTHLLLGHNSIGRLSGDWITSLPTLIRLDLSNNNFTELNLAITQYGEHYRDLFVDLSSNGIASVSLADGEIERDPDDSSVHYKLEDNPLRCGCELKAASRCATDSSDEEGSSCGIVLELDDARCSEPLSAKGQSPSSVFENLRCPPE